MVLFDSWNSENGVVSERLHLKALSTFSTNCKGGGGPL